jgi:hypothetical protein
MQVTSNFRYRDEEGRLIIGTTIMKAFKNEEHCPAKLKALFIDELGENRPTDSMLKGSFFETKVIGGGRDGHQVDDLPRMKSKDKETGEFKKYVDQIRIEQQAELFPQVVESYNFELMETQVKLHVPQDEYITLGTTSDALGIAEGKETVFDVKLTKDITSTWGDFCWGSPELMDHSQAVLTAYLYEAIYKIKPRFIYLVFDYKEKSDYEVIEKIVTATDYVELQNDIRKIIMLIGKYQNDEWFTKPSYDNCRNCPLMDTCEKKVRLKPIKYI